jgi:hypothetical protein
MESISACSRSFSSIALAILSTIRSTLGAVYALALDRGGIRGGDESGLFMKDDPSWPCIGLLGMWKDMEELLLSWVRVTLLSSHEFSLRV